MTSPGHAGTSQELANEFASDPEAARVSMNKAYRTLTGNPTDPPRRPDAALLAKDGSVTAAEVPSKTDRVLNLIARNLKVQLKMATHTRGGVFIAFPLAPPSRRQSKVSAAASGHAVLNRSPSFSSFLYRLGR